MQFYSILYSILFCILFYSILFCILFYSVFYSIFYSILFYSILHLASIILYSAIPVFYSIMQFYYILFCILFYSSLHEKLFDVQALRASILVIFTSPAKFYRPELFFYHKAFQECTTASNANILSIALFITVSDKYSQDLMKCPIRPG